MMGRTMMAALALAVLLPGMVMAEKGSWACGGEIDRDSDELDELSPNIGVRRVLQEYQIRWDASYVRSQCEAFAASEPHDIRCLNDRRDWDAIMAMVPDDLLAMSKGEVRPHYLALQAEDDGYSDALAYCRDVGAIE